MKILTLSTLFLITACLYASAGFGGGSTYTALLVLAGTEFHLIPLIALSCNIVVVMGGVWRFHRVGALRIKPLLPFLIGSIPAAWIGGRVPISETVFIGLLGIALLLAGLRLLFVNLPDENRDTRPTPMPLALFIGIALGGLAGLVGIGGGIFLAPVLYGLKWGKPREIAAACSFFILTNSLSGLFGQMVKLQDQNSLDQIVVYIPLIIAVFIGGQIGAWLSSKKLDPVLLKRITAGWILVAAVRLLWEAYQ